MYLSLLPSSGTSGSFCPSQLGRLLIFEKSLIYDLSSGNFGTVMPTR